WAGATAVVALTAWAATIVIGLPEWVFPGSLGVMAAGLPIIAFTAWVQRVAHAQYTMTPSLTPGGGVQATNAGTLHTIAIKASPHVSWRRTWMGGAIAMAVFAVLVVGWMVLRALGVGPAGSLIGGGKLAHNDQIIITDFASPATDSALGLTITEALRADLAQASVLRVMPRLATIEVLRLMRHPTDARVDFDLARAIASREGLKAVLDGEVVSLGGRYVLSTRLISAGDGAQLAAFKEEAVSQNDLIPAIGRLGKQLRARVGESLRNVRAAGALDRVTTGSMEALRKYAQANLELERTGDYNRVVPIMREAVTIDTTFAMAWRRLAQYYSNMGRFEEARSAIVTAHRYADRLSDVERFLTEASSHAIGPVVDEEKAIVAYEAVLARDSLNFIALNNVSLLLASRREFEKSAEYRLRAAGQSGTSPLTIGNALGALVTLGRFGAADSLQREFIRRYPSYPPAIAAPARIAAARGDFDSAERLQREAQPRLVATRGGSIIHLGDMADLALLRGQVKQALRYREEQRALQLQSSTRSANTRLFGGLDSVLAYATVLDDRARARAILAATVRRAPLDSIPWLDRNYDFLLAAAALAGDTASARNFHANAKRSWSDYGRVIARPAWEAVADAQLASVNGRPGEAVEHLGRADRANLPRIDILAVLRFQAFDRLGQADSAIAAGEAYLRTPHTWKFGQDALFLAGIRQRLGELYEGAGDQAKALEHYSAFVELWKNADPELQPRVRDVRGRIARLSRSRG
ncbi:MAG TPA: tetratricopeptide repeat protein, partial [Planctomycetota bacterium]|nr:tetratricopeptide repeat protein [Planctomycetota bacterium]